MQEADKDVSAACKTMQDLQVETYGSMERKEKVELILEQMRLCLATKDYIRAQIISKKISTRFFENTDYQQLKLTFYQYMIELDQHEGTYLNICRHYRYHPFLSNNLMFQGFQIAWSGFLLRSGAVNNRPLFSTSSSS